MYLRYVASPNSPEELERVVEDIYQKKPWDGWLYKTLRFLKNWSLSIIITPYIIFTLATLYVGWNPFFPILLNIPLFIFSLIGDIFLQKSRRFDEDDQRLLIKEIVQQNFKTGSKTSSLAGWVRLVLVILFIYMMIVLFKYTARISSNDFVIYSNVIMMKYFFLVCLSVFIFFIILVRQDLKQSFINATIMRHNDIYGTAEIDKFSIDIIADGEASVKPPILFYLSFSVILPSLPYLLVTKHPHHFGASLSYLYVTFLAIFIFRYFKIETFGRHNAKYYLNNYIQPNGTLKCISTIPK